MSFSRFKLIDPQKSNYVELVINEFIGKLSTHKFIKEVREKIGGKKEELELKFLYSSLSRRKEVGINVLIKFLKSKEFKTYDFDTLNLSDNSITLESLSLILGYLKENPFITKLNLSHNSLGIVNSRLKLYPQIFDYFSVNTTLKVLDLSLNEIEFGDYSNDDEFDEELDDEFYDEFYDEFNEEFDEELDEYPNKKKGYKYIIDIMNAIKSNSNCAIEEINLSFNGIEEKCMCAISKMLETNKSLKKLDLSHNKLMGSLEILGNSLLLNHTIESLNISYGSFLNENFISFLSIIKNNYSLQEIYYNDYYCDDKTIETEKINTICERNKKLVKSKGKMMNFMLAVQKQQTKKRIFPVELFDLIFSEYILLF
jgi:hypothetical protein